MSDLSKATLTDLRRPFTAGAVKMRPLGKPGNDGKAAAVFYIDSRLAVERLNAVVGPADWSDSYRLLSPAEVSNSLFFPVECSLTVCGVTKTDVGQGSTQTLDDKCWKTAYSDALKRAAVKFGVGAFLYAMPRMRAHVRVVNGRAAGFTKDGQADLIEGYEFWLSNKELNPFGEPLDHGHDNGGDEDVQPLGPGGELPAAPVPVVDYTGTPFDDSAGHPGTSADGADTTGARSGGPRPTTPAAPQPITKEQKGILEVLGAEVDKLRSTQGKVVGESWFALLSDYRVRDVSELSMEQAVDMESALRAESKALQEFEVPADIQQKLAAS